MLSEEVVWQLLMYKVYRKGDRMHPCGAPVFIEFDLLTTVHQKVKNPQNESWVNPETYQFLYHQVGLYCVEGTAEVYKHNLDKTLCLFKVLINVVCQGQQCIFNPSLWAICKLVWV